MEKIDPYDSQAKYLKWKQKHKSRLPGISEADSEILRQYLNDMETGINVSSAHKKGSRSYIRLNALKSRISYLMREFERRFKIEKIANVKELQLHEFFSGMRNGSIKRKNGKNFIAVKNYVKDFKAFWHWWMKSNRKKGVIIDDITIDLDTSGDKPRWVYLTEEEVKKLCECAKYEYKVMIWFLFDSGIRSPTELLNVRVSDFYNDFKELNIREETSKTFGRKIKLLLCSQMIKEYVHLYNLSPNAPLFEISSTGANKYLKRLAKRLFGDKISPAGQKYSELTMYDFRHCSCCYWLPRYKSESALKYRFGWKKSEKIHYYSELLGMKDTISEEDILIDLTRTEIEQRLEKSEKEKEMMQERLETMEKELQMVMETVKKFEKVVEKSIEK